MMGLNLKMAQIMGQIGQLDKDANMDAGSFSYKYVSDVSVYHTVRKLLVDYQIAVFASMTDIWQDRFVVGSDRYGNEKDKWHTRARFEFMLVDAESGENHTCTWFAESEDSADKGVNKCATAALKYWLLKTFVIPTGDDPDASNGAEQKQEDPPRQTAKTASKTRGSQPRSPKTPANGNGATSSDNAPGDPVKVLAAETFPFEDAWKMKKWQTLIQKANNWNTVFWQAVNSLHVTSDALHEALNLKSINDYQGLAGQLWLEVCKLSLAAQQTEAD